MLPVDKLDSKVIYVGHVKLLAERDSIFEIAGHITFNYKAVCKKFKYLAGVARWASMSKATVIRVLVQPASHKVQL